MEVDQMDSKGRVILFKSFHLTAIASIPTRLGTYTEYLHPILCLTLSALPR